MIKRLVTIVAAAIVGAGFLLYQALPSNEEDVQIDPNLTGIPMSTPTDGTENPVLRGAPRPEITQAEAEPEPKSEPKDPLEARIDAATNPDQKLDKYLSKTAHTYVTTNFDRWEIIPMGKDVLEGLYKTDKRAGHLASLRRRVTAWKGKEKHILTFTEGQDINPEYRNKALIEHKVDPSIASGDLDLIVDRFFNPTKHGIKGEKFSQDHYKGVFAGYITGDHDTDAWLMNVVIHATQEYWENFVRMGDELITDEIVTGNRPGNIAPAMGLVTAGERVQMLAAMAEANNVEVNTGVLVWGNGKSPGQPVYFVRDKNTKKMFAFDVGRLQKDLYVNTLTTFAWISSVNDQGKTVKQYITPEITPAKKLSFATDYEGIGHIGILNNGLSSIVPVEKEGGTYSVDAGCLVPTLYILTDKKQQHGSQDNLKNDYSILNAAILHSSGFQMPVTLDPDIKADHEVQLTKDIVGFDLTQSEYVLETLVNPKGRGDTAGAWKQVGVLKKEDGYKSWVAPNKVYRLRTNTPVLQDLAEAVTGHMHSAFYTNGFSNPKPLLQFGTK